MADDAKLKEFLDKHVIPKIDPDLLTEVATAYDRVSAIEIVPIEAERKPLSTIDIESDSMVAYKRAYQKLDCAVQKVMGGGLKNDLLFTGDMPRGATLDSIVEGVVSRSRWASEYHSHYKETATQVTGALRNKDDTNKDDPMVELIKKLKAQGATYDNPSATTPDVAAKADAPSYTVMGVSKVPKPEQLAEAAKAYNNAFNKAAKDLNDGPGISEDGPEDNPNVKNARATLSTMLKNATPSVISKARGLLADDKEAARTFEGEVALVQAQQKAQSAGRSVR